MKVARRIVQGKTNTDLMMAPAGQVHQLSHLVSSTQMLQVKMDKFCRHTRCLGKYGKVRSSMVPCDGSIQVEDVSSQLNPGDASFYRSIIGSLLYLTRDRPDLMFVIKELSGRMSKPAAFSIQCLKRVIGYMQGTADACLVLQAPTPGCGKVKQSSWKFWVLESFSDSDWASNHKRREQHQVVAFTWSVERTPLEARGLSVLLHCLHVKENFMQWCRRVVMAFS